MACSFKDICNKTYHCILERDDILDRFNFIHKRMKVSHAQIIQLPDILLSRESRTRQRHEFLKFLRKDQYDSNHELYISLKQLVEGSDKDFVVNTCESNLETFDNFIKTL